VIAVENHPLPKTSRCRKQSAAANDPASKKIRGQHDRGLFSHLVPVEVSLPVAHEITARIEVLAARKPMVEMRVEFAGFCLARAGFG